MIAIYYRTAAAIERKPVLWTVPESGLDKNDYKMVTTFHDVMSLGDVFRRMNVVDVDEDYEIPLQLGVRSMMPGDVVVDEDGDVWFCAGSGWERANW